MEKFLSFLKQITNISNQEFEEAIPLFKFKDLDKGDFFVKEGEVCSHIAFILTGTLRTYYLNDKGEDITSCFCMENRFTTSYKSFILQEPSSLILQAIEDTQLLVIDYKSLHSLYTESAVWQNIGRTIAEREYIVMEQYASVLNNESAKEKYLRLLDEQPNIIHKANIEDIASYLGVTRRTLSRIRQELSQA